MEDEEMEMEIESIDRVLTASTLKKTLSKCMCAKSLSRLFNFSISQQHSLAPKW
jgi:hypothetical protein